MQQVADITFRGTEFTYVGARTYDEAIEKAKGQKPVVVLVDSSLAGGKTGYDVCQALKSDGATQNIPVVILIGNSAPYDNAKGVAVGADANLPKPWDTQTMLEKVGEVVTKAASGVAKIGAGAGAAPAAAAAAPVAASPAAVAAKAAAPAAQQPPRSATIMGMPTVKLPGGVAPAVGAAAPVAPTAAAAPAEKAPAKTTVMAVPPVAAAAAGAAPAAGLRPPAEKAAAPSTSSSSAPAAAPALAVSGTNRAPMISGIPTKRSQLVERTLQKMAGRLAELSGLEPGSPELIALLKLSTEVVEKIVWEVVPELAEAIIRENLAAFQAGATKGATRPS